MRHSSTNSPCSLGYGLERTTCAKSTSLMVVCKIKELEICFRHNIYMIEIASAVWFGLRTRANCIETTAWLLCEIKCVSTYDISTQPHMNYTLTQATVDSLIFITCSWVSSEQTALNIIIVSIYYVSITTYAYELNKLHVSCIGKLS